MKKILLVSLGSRGDMEPFLAKGAELQKSGHKIAFCFPSQFESLAKEVSPIFFPMTEQFLALMDDPQVKKITGQIGSGWSRLRTILRLLKSTKPIQQQLIRDQRAADEAFQPDQIIYHIKCVYPVIAALRFNRQVELLSPVPCLLHAVNHEPAIGFGSPKSPWWNKMTYSIANYALIHQAILGYGNPVLKQWRTKPLKKKELKTFLLKRLPVEFAVSQALFPRPKYWPKQAIITSFRERDKLKDWKPSEALLAFLNEYPDPLYIGFGSMINGKPKEVGRVIVETCSELNQPVLINTSWGGIELNEELPENVFVVSDIPYDWLFNKVCAVVHHGGSGTTHSALRFHKKQLIIPHIADQYLWNRLIHQAGYGPLGFPIKEFNKDLFKQGVLKLLL